MLVATFLTACSGSGGDSSDNLVTRDISIPFVAEASNLTIDCDTRLTGLGTAPSDADLLDFRFYVHDMVLTDEAGTRYTTTFEQNTWQRDDLALVDLANKADSCSGDVKDTHSEVTGTVRVPAGTVLSGLEFTLGVPSALNHADRATAEAPLDRAGMHWNWQNGYKFVRVDVAPVGGMSRPTDAGYSATAWNFHLGSTDCTGDPQLGETVVCGRSNRPVVSLENFDPDLDAVLFDYEQLIGANDLSVDEAAAPGCMSGATDPECAAIFTALGMDVSTGAVDNTITQTVFRVQ